MQRIIIQTTTTGGTTSRRTIESAFKWESVMRAPTARRPCWPIWQVIAVPARIHTLNIGRYFDGVSRECLLVPRHVLYFDGPLLCSGNDKQTQDAIEFLATGDAENRSAVHSTKVTPNILHKHYSTQPLVDNVVFEQTEGNWGDHFDALWAWIGN